MPTPRLNLDNPFKPQEPSTISDADALSALLDPEDAADARRLLGDKKELPDPEPDEFVLSAEEQAVADAEQVEAEKSLEERRKGEYVLWAKVQLGKDEKWVEDTFTFHEGGTVIVEGNLILEEEEELRYLPNELTEITGSLAFNYCDNIKSLGSLEVVGGNLFLGFSSVEDLGSLRHVGGELGLEGSEVKSLKGLIEVGKDLNAVGSSLVDIGHLQKVGGQIIIDQYDTNDYSNIECNGGIIFISDEPDYN